MSPRPRRLSTEQIARVALVIADEEGLDAVTMQRVGRELGVGTMTLYGYFPSKAELLDAVIDATVQDVELPSGDGPWRDDLRALAERALDVLSRHPSLVALRFRQPVVRPDTLAFGEAAMRILQRAGFGAAEAAQAFRLIFTFVVGYAGLSPEQSTDTDRRQAAAALAALPPERFPVLTSAAAQASQAMSGAEQFAYGLERILDGLQVRVQLLEQRSERP